MSSPPNKIIKLSAMGPWNIRVESLMKLSSLYPLERTRISVKTAELSIIAERIVTCLRKLSIVAATAIAETSGDVTFFIRFYLEENNTIMVELQRKCGCTMVFRRAARVILRAAAGLEDANPSLALRKRPNRPLLKRSERPSIPIKDGDEKEAVSFVTSENEQGGAAIALEFVDDMMKKDRLDANLLGIESLLLLTKVDTVGNSTATIAARAVFGSRRGYNEIYEQVTRALEFPDDLCDALTGRHAQRMRSHALTILANSLEILLKHDKNELRAIMHRQGWLLEGNLLTKLLSELSDSEIRPHDAHQAARCLNTIITISSEGKARAIELGAPSIVSGSQRVGYCCHSLLAYESENAINSLGKIIKL
eukprot:scaffold7494_cov55-Attheya_sp.AAC.7